MSHLPYQQPIPSEVKKNKTKYCDRGVRLASLLVRISVVLFALACVPDASAQGLDGCPAGYEGGPGKVCVKQCPRPMQRINGTDLCERGIYDRRGYEEVVPYDGNGYTKMTATEHCLSDNFQPYEGWGVISNEPPRCFMQGRLAYRYCLRDHSSGPNMVCTQNCPAGFADVNGKCKSPAFQVKPSGPGPKPPVNPQRPPSNPSVQPASVPNTPAPPPVPAGPDPSARDKDGNTDLHFAILYNNLANVNKLLNLGFDANARNNGGETPVTLAAEFGQAQNLMTLLARGGDLNAAVERVIRKGRENLFRTIIGTYPIRMTNQMFDQAISSGAVGIAMLSLNYGVDPNYAMGHAVRTKNIQMIDAALEKGANADPALRFGIEYKIPDLTRRALVQHNANADLAMNIAIPINDVQTLALALERGANAKAGMAAAARGGYEPIITMLLDRGADPNPALLPAIERQDLSLVAQLLKAGADARKPANISAAAWVGNTEIVNLLIAAGARPEEGMLSAIKKNNYELVRYLLVEKNASAWAPELISWAAGLDFRNIVELLVEHGANPTDGMQGAVNLGRVEMLEFLIGRGASAKGPKLIANAAGALRMSGDRAAMVSVLLKAGADPENGIEHAVNAGLAPIAKMLIEAGASATNPALIMKAVKNGNAPVATVLLDAGAPKNGMDELGQPLVMIAALQLKVDLVKVLLANGVDPNAKNRAGDTALHVIANDEASKGYPKFKKMKKERLPMVQALVDGGADVNATNAKGETVRKSLGGGDGDVKRILDAAGAVNKLPAN